MRDTSISVESVPKILEDIYRLVEKLETLFPGRRFTPDGHLEGSIGESGPVSNAWAAAGKMQKNWQRPISVSKLKRLMNEIGHESRIKVVV